MKLHAIETGNFMLDGGAMFGVVPKTMWSKVYPSNELNLVNMSMRALLIIDGESKILIDCGLGTKMTEKQLQYYFPNGEETLHSSLAKAGVSPHEITDLILTHLHFDHCGGATKYDESGKLALVFPNARHWVSRPQWESTLKPNRRERPSFFDDNIKPLQSNLQLFDETASVTPNVQLRLYHGHTAGLIVPIINYNGKTLVYGADFLPSAAFISPAYVCAYDLFPLTTIAEKETFLLEAVQNNYTIFFEHDLYTQCATVEKTERGFKERARFSLSEFTS